MKGRFPKCRVGIKAGVRPFWNSFPMCVVGVTLGGPACVPDRSWSGLQSVQ